MPSKFREVLQHAKRGRVVPEKVITARLYK
jgi:hypothetical protein